MGDLGHAQIGRQEQALRLGQPDARRVLLEPDTGHLAEEMADPRRAEVDDRGQLGQGDPLPAVLLEVGEERPDLLALSGFGRADDARARRAAPDEDRQGAAQVGVEQVAVGRVPAAPDLGQAAQDSGQIGRPGAAARDPLERAAVSRPERGEIAGVERPAAGGSDQLRPEQDEEQVEPTAGLRQGDVGLGIVDQEDVA